MEFMTTAFLAPLLAIAGIPVFIYLYVILRWRAGSSGEPGIGSYSLVLTFRMISLLLGTGSMSLLIYAALSKGDHEDMSRICFPILIASVIFLVIQFVHGRALGSHEQFATARRLFGGGLVGIAGLVTLGSLIALFVTLWEKTSDDIDGFRADNHADKLKAFGSWLVCFGIVYLVSAVLMARGARTRCT